MVRETRVVAARPPGVRSAARTLDLAKARGHRIGSGTPVRGETEGSAYRSHRVGCRTYANGYRRYQGRSALGARQARLDGRAARRENRYLLRAAPPNSTWRVHATRRNE